MEAFASLPCSGTSTAARALQPSKHTSSLSRHVQHDASENVATQRNAIAGAAGASVVAASVGAATLRWRRRRAIGLAYRSHLVNGSRRGATLVARSAAKGTNGRGRDNSMDDDDASGKGSGKGKKTKRELNSMDDDDWGDFNPVPPGATYGAGEGDEEWDEEDDEWEEDDEFDDVDMEGQPGEEEPRGQAGPPGAAPEGFTAIDFDEDDDLDDDDLDDDDLSDWPEEGAENGAYASDGMDGDSTGRDGDYDFDRNQGAENGAYASDGMDGDSTGMDGDYDFDRNRWVRRGKRDEDFVASSTSGVFDGMGDDDMDDDDEDYMGDGPTTSSSSSASPGSPEELSLLYDDFEEIPRGKKKAAREDRDLSRYEERLDEDGDDSALKSRAANSLDRKSRRQLNSVEERLYRVEAEGIAIRSLPDERSPRTGDILRQHEEFIAIEAVDGEDQDQRTYLRLPEGRGWVFDDERIFPGFPSVKLVSIAGEQVIDEDAPKPIKRPVIAVVGRPNVGKSSLVNRICDVPDIHGAITYDEEGVTRDRTYKPGEHTDDCGDSFMFEVIDTGGLIFHDDLETVTFAKEIKMQIDVALREAAACIFVVDSTCGVTRDDIDIANYLKKNYISRGMKCVCVVAKCDRLETMDERCAEFWGLDLGEPVPVCSLHGRGVWEAMDHLIDRGCGGLFPMRIRGELAPPSERESAVSIAIVGKPNAGKSSLLNALVGEARSIVSDIPGTTTDAIDAYLEVDDGKVYRFVDTAGVRRRGRIQAGTEWLSVNRSLKAVQRADVALFVLDASEIRTGDMKKGFAYWCPDNQERYLAGAIEERGTACVIVLSKWDAVANKDEKSQKKFIEAVRSNLAGVGQWAEIVTCSSKTGQRLKTILAAVEKTLEAHQKRIPTPVLNEVVRDALLWRLPAAKSIQKKQGRIYYSVQVSTMPPTIALFCNNPKLFGPNYKVYIENKIRQDLNWFGTPLQLEWRKRSERRATSEAERWLGPRLQPETVWR